MTESLTVLKTAMDMYQAQYMATDKLWGYFSTVTLALVAYTISSDKVTRIFPETIGAVGAYIAFCIGNFAALSSSQRQLISLSDVVQHEGKAQDVDLTSFTPFPVDALGWFYWLVVISIIIVTFGLVWFRSRRGAVASVKTTANEC